MPASSTATPTGVPATRQRTDRPLQVSPRANSPAISAPSATTASASSLQSRPTMAAASSPTTVARAGDTDVKRPAASVSQTKRTVPRPRRRGTASAGSRPLPGPASASAPAPRAGSGDKRRPGRAAADLLRQVRPRRTSVRRLRPSPRWRRWGFAWRRTTRTPASPEARATCRQAKVVGGESRPPVRRKRSKRNPGPGSARTARARRLALSGSSEARPSRQASIGRSARAARDANRSRSPSRLRIRTAAPGRTTAARSGSRPSAPRTSPSVRLGSIPTWTLPGSSFTCVGDAPRTKANARVAHLACAPRRT